MIKTNISFRALDTVSQELLKLSHQLDLCIIDVKNEIAERVQEIAITNIQFGVKTGKIYERQNPSRIHQASAPGEYPANDLGNLVRSITVRPSNHHNTPAVVGSDLFYANELEVGRANMLPRPWLWPSKELAAKEMLTILRRNLEMRMK